MTSFKTYRLGEIDIKYVVSDLNGTLALDGDMIEGIAERFDALNKLGIKVIVLTGDIHKNAKALFKDYKCEVEIVDIEEKFARQDQQKLNIVKSLGTEKVLAIGNGANDALMLKKAAIGVLVIGKEGGSTTALKNADIVVHDIKDAFDLLIHPKRIAGH